MSEKPTFSVIMPSYNHEPFIADAIRSVLDQTFGDFELIIIDDASSDGSASIIRGFQRSDDRVRAFFHEKNAGIARTMNEAIGMARGKYIALFASDDIWAPDKLGRQLAVLEREPGLLVWSDGKIIDAEGRETGESFLGMHNAASRRKSGYLFDELVLENYIFGNSLALGRECLKDICYDESLAYLNDYKLMVDLSARYRFHYLEEPLACYRVHEKSAIRSSGLDLHRDRIRLRQYFLRNYSRRLTSYGKGYNCFSISMSCKAVGDIVNAGSYLILSIIFDPYNLIRLLRLFTVKVTRFAKSRSLP